MERPSKRGKIPQADWPLIMTRYEAGETLASIARTYDCSPPAISYVVSRSRARHPAAAAGHSGQPEPQLIKAVESGGANGRPTDAATATAAQPALPLAPQMPAHSWRPRPDEDIAGPANRADAPAQDAIVGAVRHDTSERAAGFHGLPPRAVPMAPRPPATPTAAPANGEQRRTLHLSLGQGPVSNGGGPPIEHPPVATQAVAASPPHPAERGTAGSGPFPPDRFATPRGDDNRAPGLSEARPATYRQEPHGGERAGRDAGSFIDHELRARVDGDITAFLAAFDAALLQDTQESRSALREATDRLLRAGARTRIELERLEARLPLPPRSNPARDDLAWRHR